MTWYSDDKKSLGVGLPEVPEEKPSPLLPLLLMGIPFLIPLLKKK